MTIQIWGYILLIKNKLLEMNIVIVANALRSSGGLTLYLQFINYLFSVCDSSQFKGDVFLIVKDSSMPEVDGANIKFYNLSSGSKIRRLLFDVQGVRKVLKKESFNPDMVISLQNVGVVALRKTPHIIYFHNAIPLYPTKWSLLKKNERPLMFYKYVYPFLLGFFKSSCHRFVVQTDPIKRLLSDMLGISLSRISVITPIVQVPDAGSLCFNPDEFHFFYPATPFPYKNHYILLQALEIIGQNYKDLLNKIYIHFSFDSADYKVIAKYVNKKSISKNIIFDGYLPKNKVYSYYKSCVALLFPSVLETVGLPLLEAASLGRPIIVADCDYSKFVMRDYKGARFVDPYNPNLWADAIIEACNLQSTYEPLVASSENIWGELLQMIHP